MTFDRCLDGFAPPEVMKPVMRKFGTAATGSGLSTPVMPVAARMSDVFTFSVVSSLVRLKPARNSLMSDEESR